MLNYFSAYKDKTHLFNVTKMDLAENRSHIQKVYQKKFNKGKIYKHICRTKRTNKQ